MRPGTIVGGYQILQIKHECKARKVCVARGGQNEKKVILGISLIKKSWNIQTIPQLNSQKKEENKRLGLVFDVFLAKNEGNTYLIQVKEHLKSLFLDQWSLNSSKTKKKSEEKIELQKRVRIILKLVKKLDKIYALGFTIRSLDERKIIVSQDEVNILGIWYHIDGVQNKGELFIHQHCNEDFLSKKKLIFKTICLGLKLITERDDSVEFEQFVNFIHNDKLKSIFEKIVQRTNEKLLMDFSFIAEQIESFWSETQKEEPELVYYEFPLDSFNESQKSSSEYKWSRKVEEKKEYERIIVKYGTKDGDDFLNLTIVHENGSKESRIFGINSLHQNILKRFQNMKNLYEFLCRSKKRLFIRENSIIFSEEAQNIPNEDSKIESNCEKQKNQSEKATLESIKLRQCKFYNTSLSDLSQINQKQYPLSMMTYLKEQIENIQLKVDIFKEELASYTSTSDTNDALKFEWLGVQKFKQGDYMRANQFFRMALTNSSKCSGQIKNFINISLYHNFALYNQRVGRHQEALINCMNSLQLSSWNKRFLNKTIDTLNVLINILSSVFGDYDEAEYYISEGVKALSSTTDVVAARFFNTVGVVKLEMQKYEESIKYFRKAVQIYKKENNCSKQSALCHLNLANAYSFSKKWSKSWGKMLTSGQMLKRNSLWKTQSCRILLNLMKNWIKTSEEEKMKKQMVKFIEKSCLYQDANFPKVIIKYLSI